MNKMKTAVIICAGGIGKRMEAGKPKQFIELADGTPILRKTADVFRGMSSAADIIVVTSPEGFEDDTECIVNKDIEGAGKAFVITGGSERQDSVKNALEFLESKGFDDDDIVLIHDGARPFVTEETIEGVRKAACEHEAAIAAVPVKDTIRDAENGTLDRSRLYAVQTPQGFRFGLILSAVRHACTDGFYGTDDGSLAEREGVMPVIVEGSYGNIKITTPEDL